ncbi:MAG: hypothetical protein HON04_13640 [Planctomicrobium sp.]|jgi:hypothetical protein|nr:hypothetical protein [Planctomicrobium sp.]
MGTLPETRLVPLTIPVGVPPATKLGGDPEWIQLEWKPECCGERMTFLGQIDSLDILEAHLPDSAIVYVFFCSKCFETESQLQCC